MFVDDLGYGDIGVYGGSHPTPHLDRMAADGLRFTDFYVAQPVCSASRAALLTGCYPNRLGFHGALGPGARHGLDPGETTLAEVCRSRGYATAAFGKWHLGHHPPFLPVHHGFDEFYGIPYSNDMWPLHPDSVDLPAGAAKRKRGYPDLTMIEGDAIVDPVVTPDDQRRFTTELTERAVRFIDAHHDEPFFLYVAHPMPHVPLFVSDRFGATAATDLYRAVVRELDWSMGAVLAALDRHDLAEETLVIFTSDNGPWLSYGNHGGVTGPLREGKGTTFEGGVRVPCVMRWTGTIAPGRVCRLPMMTIDILPTVARLIGADLPARPIDGRDASALLLDRPGAASPQPAYFFYYHRNHLEAMRAGRWKLHFPHGFRSMEGRAAGSGGRPGKYDYDRRTGLELYDLESDVGESRDVAAEYPDVVALLLELAEVMRGDLGDKLTERAATGAREPARLETEAAP
ncbi:MAG: sulfatase [Phycisphaerales bacterium]|nr:sulfatase [Phycisphaerales bacterium]